VVGGWRLKAPETGRPLGAHAWRALPLCLAAALAAASTPAGAQALTGDLFNPQQGGFAPRNPNLRQVAQGTQGNTGKPVDDAAAPVPTAPSRLGAIPTYGNPAGFGAATTGYDSFGRKKKPKVKPVARPLPGGPLRGPLTNNAALPPVPTGPVGGGPPKLAPPPSASAASGPAPAAAVGSIPGQPPRRRLPIDADPFGAPGIYYGSFLSHAAVELSGGYDTNPSRLSPARGSAFWMISPELVVTSNWTRHALSADLRGSFTGYGMTLPLDVAANNGAPMNIDRPDFIGRVDGRIDVTRDTRINGELRLRIATDNPGSPNIQQGLAKYPVYATTGGTLGVDHDFNRLNVSVSGTVDHTSYQWSKLTDGSTTSNDDRDFTQYGGIARASYDLRPGVKPFVEVEGDTRIHDQTVDRYGYIRDSDGGYVKAGSSFELTRLISGEAAVGWLMRNYRDPRLSQISGLLTSASLVWTVTPLTTAKFITTSSIDESPLPGVPGVVTRDYTWQVEHAFRRWLVGTARFGYGTSDYRGLNRFDNRFTVSADLVYKLNRTIQIKGQVRHDWLDSSLPGFNSNATVITLGVRAQQ
jgi:hypothetical protein